MKSNSREKVFGDRWSRLHRHVLNELAGWAKTHKWGAVDLFEKALKELKEKQLA